MPHDHYHLFPRHEGLETCVEGFMALFDDRYPILPDHVLRSREQLFEQLVLRAELDQDGPIAQPKLVCPLCVTFVDGGRGIANAEEFHYSLLARETRHIARFVP